MSDNFSIFAMVFRIRYGFNEGKRIKQRNK